uniref:Immunoglobulin V-set domain-containing protein n=1 Tax=Seriola dumerili TaxID=41447 RepID=A0A3B4UBF2_SERDU
MGLSTFKLMEPSALMVMNMRKWFNFTMNSANKNIELSNVKYLCQSPCKEDQHIIIKAESGKTSHKDRIHLVNKGKNLFVTITDLQMSDSKKFLCGLERYGPDSFIEVDLKVKHGKSMPVAAQPSSCVGYCFRAMKVN